MADETRIETLPLFPLSNVVLFPRGRVPLHVFEPRYRQMAAAALAGDRRIGMIAVHPDGVEQMGGNPELFPIGCAGLVQQTRRHEDGRYDIVLLGTNRFRVLEETPCSSERLYRLARVEVLEDAFDEGRESIPLQGLRVEVVELLGELLRHLAPRAAGELDPRRFSGVDDATFVNVLCQLLDLPPREKQGLLAANGLLERCAQLEMLLRFRVAELGGGAVGPSETGH